MDFDKIFLEDACPTSVGGQAVMEGVMMRGEERTSVVLRLPDGRLHIKTEPNKKTNKLSKIPIIRGCIMFFMSMITGIEILFYSAKVLEDAEGIEEEPSGLEKKIIEKFGKDASWNIMVYISLIVSIAISVGVFILLPTVLVNFMRIFIENSIILNLIEGIVRLLIFLIYIWLIGKMPDVKRLFQYHGAEHKSIHCFEKNLELIPENAQGFYTLHPRCGTSFVMFVMIISILLFSLFGWPGLLMRILTRIILIPVVAGLSYEVLKVAGRSNGKFIRLLSLPGLYLQKLTTAEPEYDQLEVALAALKAVLVDKDTPFVEGYCNKDGEIIDYDECHPELIGEIFMGSGE